MSSFFFGPLESGVAPARTDRHRLAGVVTIDGVPSRRVVGVFDRRSLSLIAAAISEATTGEWELAGLPEYPEAALLVVALDNTGTYNAEVADYVSQVTGAGV